MEIKIINKKDNPLLEREEIEAIIKEYDATPSKESLLNELSNKLNVDKNNVLLFVFQEYGKREAKGIIYVYKNKDLKERFNKRKAKKKEENKAQNEVKNNG